MVHPKSVGVVLIAMKLAPLSNANSLGCMSPDSVSAAHRLACSRTCMHVNPLLSCAPSHVLPHLGARVTTTQGKSASTTHTCMGARVLISSHSCPLTGLGGIHQSTATGLAFRSACKSVHSIVASIADGRFGVRNIAWVLPSSPCVTMVGSEQGTSARE